MTSGSKVRAEIWLKPQGYYLYRWQATSVMAFEALAAPDLKPSPADQNCEGSEESSSAPSNNPDIS